MKVIPLKLSFEFFLITETPKLTKESMPEQFETYWSKAALPFAKLVQSCFGCPFSFFFKGLRNVLSHVSGQENPITFSEQDTCLLNMKILPEDQVSFVSKAEVSSVQPAGQNQRRGGGHEHE